jgi:hypothetical protein
MGWAHKKLTHPTFRKGRNQSNKSRQLQPSGDPDTKLKAAHRSRCFLVPNKKHENGL